MTRRMAVSPGWLSTMGRLTPLAMTSSIALDDRSGRREGGRERERQGGREGKKEGVRERGRKGTGKQ